MLKESGGAPAIRMPKASLRTRVCIVCSTSTLQHYCHYMHTVWLQDFSSKATLPKGLVLRLVVAHPPPSAPR